jgi:hypothetical protein
MTRRVEQAVLAAGVPINVPRSQAYHSTLGQVQLSYPSDKVVVRLPFSLVSWLLSRDAACCACFLCFLCVVLLIVSVHAARLSIPLNLLFVVRSNC